MAGQLQVDAHESERKLLINLDNAAEAYSVIQEHAGDWKAASPSRTDTWT
jgi:hypothetical protein